jgi:predicted RNase H-like nuclease
MRIVGIDLAWGERNPDGICVFKEEPASQEWTLEDWYLSSGDAALSQRAKLWSREGPVWLMVDAPLLCRNRAGRRPVDAECQKIFHAFDAGPYPVNQSMASVQRALRFSRLMQKAGWPVDWDPMADRQMIEVFPHPALVRFFGLKKTYKYKKGRVSDRRLEFSKLQRRLRGLLDEELPGVAKSVEAYGLLRQPWQKPVEDQVDALICVLVGWKHWSTQGKGTEVIGDNRSGFILVPRD